MSNLLGTIQTMTVNRKIETGYVLKRKTMEALLHHNEAKSELAIDQKIDVFLYQNKKKQLIATTYLPAIQIDIYGWAKVIEVIDGLGVFVNIGTTKEMLVSIDDLPLIEDVWPKPGDKLYVTLGNDRKGRLLAIPATEKIFASEWNFASHELLNKSVKGRVYHTSREGSAIITEDGYRGFIHYTERKIEPRLGQLVEGRVIDVKDDCTINVSLRPLKQHSMYEDADMILIKLEENNGVIPFSDKSDPEDIRETFNISKAALKRALGKLMKEGKIEQRGGYTYSIKKTKE
ncbi:CvfB family protein [Virgibacillus alimentarius]|uniref:RNA-binding protein (Virulence factor B family) n=1 Tax=Virgibacillus alimentarius TaxID=698769 RepID=A0ABS4SAG1_9BACI|nr:MULTISPECIES: S1-like domain-containing RNA-binding protein [Virgibacillus]MBP2257869.1 putative RNA-binding protein (virulence factor B family) [Virgibacillus alimentarius]HLR68299.1 S1-like domain-containing RNA-binding protein [Virgibacillus sp.]